MGGAGTGNHLENEFLGSSPNSNVTVTIKSGGLIVDRVGTQNPLGPLVLDGGTLQSAVGFTNGNWVLSGSVSTPGDGSTSYISGGTIEV